MPIQSEGYLDKSKIRTFLACPARYKYQYIDKVEPRKTTEMIEGDILHKVAYGLYENFDKLSFLADPEEYIRTNVARLAEELGATDTKLYENFIRYEIFRWRKTLDIDAFIPRYRETYFKRDDYKVEGTIDRVIVVDNVEVLEDIKTSHSPKFATSIKSYVDELTLYLFLLRGNGIDIRIGNLYFAGDHQTLTFKFEEREIERWKYKLPRIAEKIRLSDFPKKVGNLCRFCPFVVHCLP